jgi:bifunctional DNA-binding transcriptional regulator/antitoxin component of YhaV-PrlF toxin-antitoxin module
MAMTKKQKFKVTFEKHPDLNSGYFTIPFSVHEVFGKKSGVKVKVKINGIEHRGYLMPQGDGTHCMGFKKELREKMKISYGDKITVEMEEDTEKRIIVVPLELESIFNKNKSAKKYFESLSFTNQNEYIKWINSARRCETRKERINQSIVKLKLGKKNPYDK